MYFVNVIFALLLIIKQFDIFVAQQQCINAFNEAGHCVRLRQCHFLNRHFENNIYPIKREIIQNVIKYKCGYDYSNCFNEDNCRAPILQLKVCCPSNPSNLDQRITTSDDDSGFNKDHPNLSLLNTEYDCGQITRGNNFATRTADLLEFPWLALLKYEIDLNTDDTFKCSGSLINERYVLTSAKCAQYDRITSVVLGENVLFQNDDCDATQTSRRCANPTQKLKVEEIVVHPDYDKETYANNIALIRLSQPADFSKNNVKAICLPINNQLMNVDLRQLNLILTGILSDSNSPRYNVVKANVSIIDNANCEPTYHNTRAAGGTHFCSRNTRQSCDFELPSILQSAVNYNGRQRYVQFGIHSTARTSIACENKDLDVPDIYTRVGSYNNWILDNLKP